MSWQFSLEKKSRSVFDFFTCSRGSRFLFLYEKEEAFMGLIRASEKIDNSLSFGVKQNSLWQTFFELSFFKDLFIKNSNWISFYFQLDTTRLYTTTGDHGKKWSEPLCSGDVRTISWYNTPKKIWRSSDVGKITPPPPPE